MTNITQAQGLVQGLDIGSLLTLQISPLWAYLAMAVGLAMCLAGYYLYRFMVAVAAAIAGGALVYLLAPTFNLNGTALLTTAIGAVLVLLVVGWLLYSLAVFVLGGAVGFSFGVALWLIGSGTLTGLGDLAHLTISSANLPAAIATALFPAVALAVVVSTWERRLTTLFTVMLGGTVFAFGLRYSGFSQGVREWGPVVGTAAIIVGLYLNYLSSLAPTTGTTRAPGKRRQQAGKPKTTAARHASASVARPARR